MDLSSATEPTSTSGTPRASAVGDRGASALMTRACMCSRDGSADAADAALRMGSGCTSSATPH